MFMLDNYNNCFASSLSFLLSYAIVFVYEIKLVITVKYYVVLSNIQSCSSVELATRFVEHRVLDNIHYWN